MALSSPLLFMGAIMNSNTIILVDHINIGDSTTSYAKYGNKGIGVKRSPIELTQITLGQGGHWYGSTGRYNKYIFNSPIPLTTLTDAITCHRNELCIKPDGHKGACKCVARS